MSTNLTLRNVPDEVYRRLKATAEQNRCSLSSEAIVCLEAVLQPGKLAPSERLARARRLREMLGPVRFEPDDTDA